VALALPAALLSTSMDAPVDRLRGVLGGEPLVRLASAFGSAAAGWQRPGSDGDVAVRAMARGADTAHLRRVQAQCLHEWAEEYRAGTP